MNLFLIIFIPVFCIMLVLSGYVIYKNIKNFNTGNYKVKHRLDDAGNLQYSVDGKTWTYIVRYIENYNYGTYHGPALGFIQFKSKEDRNYESWCNMLWSLQKCHDFNKKELSSYIEKLKEFLKDHSKEN